MAPRKQAKQAAAESVQIAAADGNVTPPKKRKAAAKSTTPKQAKTAAPRQVRQVKAQEAATAFSPKNLRSRQKDVAPKNDAENKSKKMFVNKQKEEKKTVEDDDNTGEQVEKKTRGGGRSAVTKKAGTKTATAKPKAKAPVVKKKKDQVENGAGNVGNGIVTDENPPKRATRRGKAPDEENVAPAATKVRVIKRPRKRKTAETEAIAEAEDDEEPPEKNDAEMIVDNKKSREKAKKTAKAAVKEKKDSTKISKGKRNIEKEIKDVGKEEGISMNLELESVDENDTSVDESNNVSHNENNKAEIKIEKDNEENINDTTAFERSATFMLFE